MHVARDPRKSALAILFVAILFMAPLGTLGVSEGAAQGSVQAVEDPPVPTPPAEPVSSHTGDPFWLTLDGFSTKSGYRMVFFWETAEPISGVVRWGFAPDALDNLAVPVGSAIDTAQMAYMDTARGDIGKRVYFEVLDQNDGTVSPIKSFRLGNAWNSERDVDGVYTINAVLQLDAKSLPDDVPFDAGLTELARGIDILAERIWDYTDGQARLGKVIVTDTAPQYPAYQPSGPGVCTSTQDVEGHAVQHTLADFVVQTTIPFDSHTWGGGTPVIDDPCTAFYIGRIGQLVIPWESDAHLGYVMAHELGHYAFGLPDLYEIGVPGGCANRDPNHVAHDVSIMHNSGGWTGSRWDLTELDRGWTDCDRSVGDQEVSWDAFRLWYPEVPATTAADIDRSDSDPLLLRDNPDGGALDVYIMNQLPGSSAVDHFIVASSADEEETGPDVRITAPDSGASMAPGVADISGTVDRFGVANAAPVGTISPDVSSGDPPLDVTFTLGGSDPDGTIASWSLDLGDGSPILSGASAPPSSRSHTYGADGTYTAVLRLTDDAGKTGTAEAVIIVGGGGALRIGTDPAGDAPTTGACSSQAAQCDHAWTAAAAPGLDLVASYVEDRGDVLRVSWQVVDSDQFFVDPSGDPSAETDESRIIGYQITTGFTTSPATSYRVSIERARGSTDLTPRLSTEFVLLSRGTATGSAGHDPARDLFWVDVPKSAFPELGAVSTLSNLRSLSETRQVGTGSVTYLATKDNLDRIDNSEYVMESTLDLLGTVPNLQVAPQDPPSDAPSDPEVDDPAGDAFVAGTVVGHTDIEAAWFDHDADHLYVGMKVVDIPADPATTTNVAYHVNFKPDWTSTGWSPATAANFDSLRVHASIDLTRGHAEPSFELQVLYTATTGSTFATRADLPASQMDADTDIIWFVIPRLALQSPPPGATISGFSADTAMSVDGLFTFSSGLLTDTAAAARPDYKLVETVPLRAEAGGPHDAFTGHKATLSAALSGGESPYGCSWTTAADGVFTASSACTTEVSFATPGDKIVTLGVTDAGGNTTTTTTLVAVRNMTDERVELTLSGDLIAVAPVFTGGNTQTFAWDRQVDLTGRSGEHTLVATWYDADDTVLDSHARDVVVTDRPAPFVTIDEPAADTVVSGIVTVGGTAGHGAGPDALEEASVAFGPRGLFQEAAFAQREGHIQTFCAGCEDIRQNGTTIWSGSLLFSLAWATSNPGGTYDGLDGRWLDVSGFHNAKYALTTQFGTPADLYFFASPGDLEAAATGTDVGPDAEKSGIVPSGSNWAFVYLRRPTAENATSLHGVDETVKLVLTPPVSAPRALTGSAAWDTTAITWDAPEWDGGSDITGYKVHRDGALVATVGAVGHHSEGGLTPDTTYAYTVTAVNALGEEGPASAPLLLHTGNDATAPDAVTDLTTDSVTNASAHISWTAASDPESGISHYRVTRDGIAVGTTSGTTFSESGLQEDTTYVYEVEPVNGQGLRGPRSAVSVTTLLTPVVETVSLFVDDTFIGNATVSTEDGDAAWSVPWDTRFYDDGTYTLQASYDDGRGGLDLAQVLVEVDNVPLKPDVTVSTPANGSVKAPPLQLKGEWTTIGDQSAPLGSAPADAMHPFLLDWYGRDWVQTTLHSPAYQSLLDRLHDLDGFLSAYPTTEFGNAIVVLLDGPVPSDAPSQGLGVPLRYVPDLTASPLVAEAGAEAPAMSLEEFEQWATEFTGPQTPGVQQGAGPGSAIQFGKASGGTFICSTSYLYEDPDSGKYYLSTAGHCLYESDVGDSNSHPQNRDPWVSICVAECGSNALGLGHYVRLEANDTYHPVAYGIAQGQGADFGLIDIPESLYRYLRPHLTLWGGPTEFTRPLIGDPLVHYGHGCGEVCGPGVAYPGQGRLGVTLDPSKELGLWAAGWVVGGDSGSAVGTAFPRPDELLVGDGATGVITHSIEIVGLPYFIATDLERGLELANMTHLKLVTEDAEIRLPDAPQPDAPGVAIDVPAEGAHIDRFAESPVTVRGTGAFDAGAQTGGTATKTYYLHRDACGSGNDRLWMDEVLLGPEHGGSGCGSLLAGAWPLTGALVDVHPADPLPDATTYVDPSRDVVATVYIRGDGHDQMLISYEARLSYGATVVAEARVDHAVHAGGPLRIAMDPLVETIPRAAELEFTFVLHQSATPAFIRHGGSAPSRVEIPISEPDASVELSLDDPDFGLANLIPTEGTERWSAAWDVSGLPEGNHTLYARAVVEGAVQGTVQQRTVNLTGTPPPEPPTADFVSTATDLTVHFDDTSVAGSSPITAWQWDFGDGATSNASSPTHTYTADGTYDVTLTVTDAEGLSDSRTQTLSVKMGIVAYLVEVRLVGPAGEAIGWTEVANPLEGESGEWALLWDPVDRPAEGDYIVEVRMLRDGVLVASNTSGFAVDINVAPSFVPIGDKNVEENSLLTFDVTATDPDGDLLGLGATGLPSGATFVDNGDNTGTFSWTPGTGTHGTYTVGFTAQDAEYNVSTSVSILVFEESVPPVLDPIADQTIAEGEALGLPITGSDLNGDTLTLSVTPLPPGARVTKVSAGQWTLAWRPSYTQHGTYALEATLSDGTSSVHDAFNITVTDVDVPPEVTSAPDVTVIVGIPNAAYVTAKDLDGDAVTLTVTGAPSWATFTDGGDGRGRFDLTAPPHDSGRTFTVTLTAASTNQSTTAKFKLTAIGYMELTLTPTGTGISSASPGATHNLGTVVKNSGNAPGWVHFQGNVPLAGWSVSPPADVYLAPGESRTLPFSMVPGPTGSSAQLTLKAIARDFPDTSTQTSYIIRIPVLLEVELGSTSAVFGTEGVVRATFLDGSPAEGVAVTVTDVHQAGAPFRNEASGVTDENGTFAFRFDLNSPGGQLPGEHTLTVRGVRDGATTTRTQTYLVTV